jgi:uncharacterized protein (DUF3820 family)
METMAITALDKEKAAAPVSLPRAGTAATLRMRGMKTSSFPKTTQPPQSPLMPFGAFKGSRLDQLPADYLLWLSTLNDLRQPLLGHVLREMGRRMMEVDQHLAPSGHAKAGG